MQARWVARLSDQLGGFRAELMHPGGGAPSWTTRWRWRCCRRSAPWPRVRCRNGSRMPRCSPAWSHLLPRLALGETVLPELVRWETVLLADLGYGLDLTSCAVTGATEGLAFVSPKTGRAVTAEGAGIWTPAAASAAVPGRRQRGRAGGLARRAAPDRAFSGPRRVRRGGIARCPGAPDAVRPRRRRWPPSDLENRDAG